MHSLKWEARLRGNFVTALRAVNEAVEALGLVRSFLAALKTQYKKKQKRKRVKTAASLMYSSNLPARPPHRAVRADGRATAGQAARR